MRVFHLVDGPKEPNPEDSKQSEAEGVTGPFALNTKISMMNHAVCGPLKISTLFQYFFGAN